VVEFALLEVLGRTERAAFRVDWLSRALAALAGSAVVFVDPDRGLRRSDHKKPSWRPKAVKHAYLDELGPFIGRGQSVVASHHTSGSDKVRKQARRLMGDAAEELGVEPLAAVRADRGSTRLFLVLPVDAHRSHLERRLTALTGSPWAGRTRRHLARVAPLHPTVRERRSGYGRR